MSKLIYSVETIILLEQATKTQQLEFNKAIKEFEQVCVKQTDVDMVTLALIKLLHVINKDKESIFNKMFGPIEES